MKLGVIGVGNMGAAIIKGYIASGASPSDIYIYQRSADKKKAFADETGVNACDSVVELADACDSIMIAVKPAQVREVLAQISDRLSDKVLISIAAGITVDQLAEAGGVKIVRVMPNTPSQIGCGMSAVCRSKNVSDEEFADVINIFESIGRAAEVSESLMDAVTGVSGSGPAYVYLFIEAMADGGVLAGMPRPMAVEFAAQTVLGAAKMVLETGQHPGALKDAVCSPGGTTIEAIRNLEAGGFRSTVMEAVIASAEKSEEMTNN